MAAEQKVDFSLKETKPKIGGGRFAGSGNAKLTSSLDLVETEQFLFIRVVKLRELPWNNAPNPFVEIKIGNYKGTTKYLDNKPKLEWNQVFAFRKERIQSLSVEITVREKQLIGEDSFIGKISINISSIPTRVPPDSPLAPEWFKLEDRNGVTMGRGELMLVLWFGTQADEVFPCAWHSDTATIINGESIINTRSKVYLSPRLWYLRLNVIQAQDLVPAHKNRIPEVYVKATVGTENLRTKVSADKSVNPKWNEELMFVVAEPFDDPLILTVEDEIENNQKECLGRCVIPLSKVSKRWLPEAVGAKWYNLEKFTAPADHHMNPKEVKFASKLNMGISLDGGYHVFDESINCSSDYRATVKALWTPVIGVVEVGIIGATSLVPMKSRGRRKTTDAYCVAKYGPKWVRTRTIVDSFSPKWNEQYTWEVYDPYTVLTVGVFDNTHLHRDDMFGPPMYSRIAKLRIRLSTLSTNRVYTYSFPLIALQPRGVKKMGEIQLAVRFSCPSFLNLLTAYTRCLLPKMHYTHPLSVYQLDSLRHQANRVLSKRLSRSEPPLIEEVIEFMLDAGRPMWSLRSGKANLERLMAALDVFVKAWKWFHHMRKWKNLTATILVILLYLIIVNHPNLILPTLLCHCILTGIKQYRKRRRGPPHMDIKLSLADTTNADDLDEEFDTFPSCKQGNVLRMRYDRLRTIAGRVMVMVGDMATQAERLNSVVNWEDPRATAIFMVCFLIGALLLSWIPFRYFLIVVGIYVMRPPRFGLDVPSAPQSLFRRLPTRRDYML